MQTTHPTPSNMATSQPKRPRGRPVGVKASGLRVRAWRAVRGFKKSANHQPLFTLGDVLDIVATGREKNASSNLQKYLSALERHGVITRLARRAKGTAPTSPGAVIWRLQTDLGWYAPVWRMRSKTLYDPNRQTLLPLLPDTPKTPLNTAGAQA